MEINSQGMFIFAKVPQLHDAKVLNCFRVSNSLFMQMRCGMVCTCLHECTLAMRHRLFPNRLSSTKRDLIFVQPCSLLNIPCFICFVVFCTFVKVVLTSLP